MNMNIPLFHGTLNDCSMNLFTENQYVRKNILFAANFGLTSLGRGFACSRCVRVPAKVTIGYYSPKLKKI